MRRICSKLVLSLGALSIAVVFVPGALAQCGLSTRLAKPAAWHPQFDHAQLKAAPDDHNGFSNFGPSIVGMWHVVFNAQTMNDAPFSAPIDNAIVQWHSDGTELMNSARPAQDGSFCMGVWVQTGPRSYYLNHFPWQGNDTENAPSGIGNPQDGAQLTEQVILSPDGNSYSGSFKLVAYGSTGAVAATFTGTISATRITVSTPFTSLIQ